MGFKTLREHSQKWTAVQKGQNFHLILDKCNTITAELLENETVKYHAQCSRDFKSDIKLDSVLKQKAKEKEESSTEITLVQQQVEPSDITMRRKSKETMKEEKCFACGKKTNRKKRSRHFETLSRVERDNGSSTLIDAITKMKIYQISGYKVLPSDWKSRRFRRWCVVPSLML